MTTTVTDIKELAACPFCGGADVTLDGIPENMIADCCDVSVRCLDCGAVGPSMLYDQSEETDDPTPEAIEAWNRRAPSASMGRVTDARCIEAAAWGILLVRFYNPEPEMYASLDAFYSAIRNTDHWHDALAEAKAALDAALDSPPDHGGGEGELLATMAKHLGWELDWGPRDPNDEEGEYGWRVHDRRGNRSDLEWTLIGFGASPADALRAALRSQP